MLPITCLTVSGCGKKDYDIKTFYTCYKNIANNTSNLSLIVADDIYQINNGYKIDINYTKSSKLSTLVEDDDTHYYHLKYFYQQLLDDSLSPLYFWGENIANVKKISKSQTKELFNTLSMLEQDYMDIDHYLGILINSLSDSNESTTVNLSYLKKVFNEYEQAITTANKLSILICEIYFDKVVNTPNYNYSVKTSTQLNEADLTRISSDVRTRTYYYKSVYANIYNQLYLRENNWAETLSTITNVTLPYYAPYNNMKSITSLASNSMSSLLVNKDSIYTNAVALYNIQNSFATAYNNFDIATNNIVYSKLDVSSSNDEHNYGTIINQFSNGIAMDSYEILNKLINLLYS